MIPVTRIFLLYLQKVLIIAGQVNSTFTVNAVIFWSSKANTWRLENISCNRNEPKEYTNTWQITEVSNSTKDNSGNHAEF